MQCADTDERLPILHKKMYDDFVEAIDGNAFSVGWALGGGGALALTANLSDSPCDRPGNFAGAPFFIHPADMDAATRTLAPWSVIATLSV